VIDNDDDTLWFFGMTESRRASSPTGRRAVRLRPSLRPARSLTLAYGELREITWKPGRTA
jgi:hypothetical protein